MKGGGGVIYVADRWDLPGQGDANDTNYRRGNYLTNHSIIVPVLIL